jgi:hypothetical protein
MAAPVRAYASLKTWRRFEFHCPLPGYAKDVHDAIHLAREAAANLNHDVSYDDSLNVRADDDEIVVWFDIEVVS